MTGERWHGKLVTRAVDPGYGERRVVDRDGDGVVHRRDDWRTSVERPARTSVERRDADDRVERTETIDVDRR